MKRYTSRDLDRMIMLKPWEARMLMEERKMKEAIRNALIECGHTEEEIEEIMKSGVIQTEITDERGRVILIFH